MGILNITPDSFSDGGLYLESGPAVEKALEMESEGADLIDVGGESSRPGAPPVPAREEIRRVLPVIRKLAGRMKIPMSIDTTKAAIAAAALDEGAVIVNDISAFRADPAMAGMVAERGAGCVLMHMQGEPGTMQLHPYYENVVAEVALFLRERIEAAIEAGVDPEAVAIDPGIGFGKTLDHNLRLLAELSAFRRLGRPVMLGTSRKGMIGKILGTSENDRVEGTTATVAAGALLGADIVRVHDVREIVRVVKVIDRIRGASEAVVQ